MAFLYIFAFIGVIVTVSIGSLIVDGLFRDWYKYYQNKTYIHDFYVPFYSGINIEESLKENEIKYIKKHRLNGLYSNDLYSFKSETDYIFVKMMYGWIKQPERLK